MTFHVAVALTAFLLALLGTRLTIQALKRRPQPPDIALLRSGKAPVPRGGGIAVVFALVVALLAAGANYGIVLALLLLTAISLLDGLIGVAWPIRILVQVMAVTVPISMTDALLFRELLPPWLDHLAVAVLWLGFANMFACLDNADGVAASEMGAIGAGLCLLAVMTGTFPDALSVYGLIVVAAAAGFLWWNWPPARIHLSQVGSVPIGFLLGWLLLEAALKGYAFAAMILPAYCLCDVLITLGRRKNRSGEAPPVYYYQQAARRGLKPEIIVRYVLGINILLIFLALRATLEPSIAVFHLTTGYLTVFILLGLFSHAKPSAGP